MSQHDHSHLDELDDEPAAEEEPTVAEQREAQHREVGRAWLDQIRNDLKAAQDRR